ncbi:hypothetical protein PVL29_020976 [Vitis rotundifolia]|uniref:SMC hinge domain-containing protein n=1 Tax=Vitis rotundifolia TaxID=103349 RepID=A0AA38YY98_VITRO|nr:hypothetical protein PVL29_020976 [Vitis rotundifolia]
MQGRITKVLNMKPPEILSMLEEAAGTRMYETKKEAALKTLEKKQSKVDEIDKLLDQEILPALEKLRKERMQYMQWANGNAELDRLKRFCIAYEFVQAEKIRDSAVSGVEQVKTKIADIEDSHKRMQVEIQEMETQVSNLTAEKEASMGGEVKVLSENVDALSRELVKQASVLKNQEDTLRSEKENAEKIVRGIEDLKQSVEERASAVKRAEDGAADLKQRVEELSKNLEECEKDGSEDKCLEDQLADAKVAVGSAETELKQLNTKITHCEKELKEKTNELISKHEEAVSVENELNVRRKDVENIKMALESLTYKEGQMEALQKERALELDMVQKLKDDTRILSAQLGNVQFTYHDPVKNFDRSRVKGVVAKLIKVKDSSTMTALEVAAGGKLFNVVVDTENTGKLLLQNGDLRRRVGKENAELALSLVGFDEELKSAMEYVFGSTFVCISIDAAKEVAFNRDISTPSVTLDGDIFQPSGLLTGGSRKGGGDLLRQLHALAEAESKLSTHQQNLNGRILSLIQRLKLAWKKNENFKAYTFIEGIVRISFMVNECSSEILYLEASNLMHENEKERLIMEMEAVIEERASLESQLACLRGQIDSLTSEVDQLKNKVSSIKNNHDQAQSELNLIRLKMKECDSQISCILKEQEKLQHKLSEMNIERKKLENEVKRMEMEQKDCSSKVEKLIEKHAWIASEKQLFGRSGTDYDFACRDPSKARAELDKLQTEQSGLEKRVNKKVMAMFEKAEDEYNELISKKSIIENDKSKIKMVIEELDEKKKETLKVTWTKVNKDFGSIFSTLLPGTMAKLEPPEGCSFLDGLEVRVAFGSVWKQSLSELSGGQRSLLALSLILALLLFKPAPLYILDEVDAALDLSHTQNIGRMIKSHFPHSSSLWFLLKKACSIMPMFFSGQNLWMVFPQFRELLQLSRTSDFVIFLVSALKRYVLTQFDVYSCNPYMTILLNNL